MGSYEEFTETQIKILERFVTNTKGNVFVLRNLPEVIKGALFSRYSRSSLGLRSLLLKEFVLGEETAFDAIVGQDGFVEKEDPENQVIAIKKAQNFYDRILDGYGDDSIGELGGAHLAIENISMIGAKIIEDSRIGGSPLEKSTRYIYFDQKVNGEYLYYREPILMTSAYKETYLKICDMLFDTYSKLIPKVTEMMEKKFPKDADSSKAAYVAALRARVLDCLRGLLPAGTLTNMGVYGNGRFWEQLIHRLHCHPLAELQDVGKGTYDELSKVIPSFVRRAECHHHHHESYSKFCDALLAELQNVTDHQQVVSAETKPGVKLISHDPDGPYKVAGVLLYRFNHYSLETLQNHCRNLSHEELAKIFDAASTMREHRRHKSPRALEHAQFTFEIVADFGIYRDLHRHRMLTQERQLLTCDYGFTLPSDLLDTPMEKIYRDAMSRAKEEHAKMAIELAEEAQYIVPMAYNVRYYFHVNLRALQWLCELRSQAAGHPNYRFVAQEMARQVIEAVPAFEAFFKFVDYDGHEFGRLGQEERKIAKQTKPEYTETD
ncbi:MAG: FAD-dependent thymidylate synthase [Chlamydiia bacterium]|nr:FAD-dependent thymidylate synthase [Chlamydiia bacterium]